MLLNIPLDYQVAASGLCLRVVLRHKGRGPSGKREDLPEIIFASCDFEVGLAPVAAASSPLALAAGESPSIATEDIAPVSESGGGGAGRYSVVLIDQWSIAGGKST